MKVYIGGVGARAALAKIRAKGHGRLVTAASWKNPIPGLPWCLDNGAYSTWNAWRKRAWQSRTTEAPIPKRPPFDAHRFVHALARTPIEGILKPDFVVLPDIVAGGKASPSGV